MKNTKREVGSRYSTLLVVHEKCRSTSLLERKPTLLHFAQSGKSLVLLQTSHDFRFSADKKLESEVHLLREYISIFFKDGKIYYTLYRK